MRAWRRKKVFWREVRRAIVGGGMGDVIRSLLIGRTVLAGRVIDRKSLRCIVLLSYLFRE